MAKIPFALLPTMLALGLSACGSSSSESDDPVIPEVSVASASVLEGDSGTQNLNFTVSLNQAGSADVTVQVSTADGTASAGSDYTALANQSVNIPAGQTSATVSVPVAGDTAVETDETLTVTLSGPQNATLASGGESATGTISNDDVPQISIADASVVEGDSGDSNMSFTLTMDQASPVDVTVLATTTSGSASAGTDYTAITEQRITIPAGQTSATLNINVRGDTTVEADETLSVLLTQPVNASLADNSASGTITNDDVLRADLSIADASVTEGDSGQTQMQFTLSLSPAMSADVTVEASTADGSALAGSDYAAVSNQVVTIPAGQTSAILSIDVNGDILVESDENFSVNLANASSNAVITDLGAIGTIVNDDVTVGTLSVADVSIVEGDSGLKNLVFTLNLSQPVLGDVTVEASTADGTAIAGADYSALNAQIALIPAGQTSTTVSVPIIGDTTVEADETLTLNLANVSGNATLGNASATGTISNDDLSQISISDVTAAEAAGPLQFTVSVDQPGVNDITMDINTADGSATAGSDYTALVAQQVTIPAGQTSVTVNVPVSDDTDVETDETFTATLSNPSGNAVLLDASGTGTIENDDVVTATLDVSGGSLVEGASGITQLAFNLTLSGAVASDVTVEVSTVDGTATAGSDYSSIVSQLVTIPSGQTSATVNVDIAGDTIVELDETFDVTLANITGDAVLGTASATGTITNDDLSVISIADSSAPENAGPVQFTVSLDQPGASDVTVEISTADGSATAGVDYTGLASQLVTIPAGSTSATVDVTIANDADPEPAETFSVNLANPSANATIGTASATGTIHDIATLSVGDATVVEGDSGTAQLVFDLSLSGPVGTDVTVEVSTADGTATTADGDYSALVSQVATITSGNTSTTVAVDVNGDTAVEDHETLTVTLANVTGNAVLGTSTGNGTITDDDTPELSISGGSTLEGDLGAANSIDFTVSISPTSAGDVTVDYATSTEFGDGATADTDYTSDAGQVTITAGQSSATITVGVIGDTNPEGFEAFTVTLSNNPVGTRIAVASDQGTIVDDDAASLNDTGVTSCSDDGSNGLDCTTTAVTHPGQDADHGRDKLLNDDSDGEAGFRFTKLDATGAELAAGASNWSCVRDDVTGLIWEVKTNDSGVQDRDNEYTWFSSDTATNGGGSGEADLDPGTVDNTEAYIAAVNGLALCGFTDWRLPHVDELFGLMDLGDPTGPVIDESYFPHQQPEKYWSADSEAARAGFFAWTAEFDSGFISPERKTTGSAPATSHAVRLVRGDI